MLRSMTGYGKGEAETPMGRFVVEVRSVNHRYGEVTVKLPRLFMSYEHELRKLAGTSIKRGKADLFVQWDEASGDFQAQPVNMAVAKGYMTAFHDLARELRLSPEIPLSLIVSQRNVLSDISSDASVDELAPQLMRAASDALLRHDEMRRTEGEALLTDLRNRRLELSGMLEQIRERTPGVVAEYRERLRQRLDKLLEGVDLDQQRLAQEVALMADRSDITEEIVRLCSHFSQFDETLLLSEPVGRKLDFIMQEMNREVNTIGSKSNDASITSLVVRIKAEMEKMREQVQNIE